MQGFWNGLPTEVVQGTAIVASETPFPNYWGKDLAGQRINVIRVNLEGVNLYCTRFGGGVTYLDDREGQGTFKVTEGMGSPRWGHRDVVIEEGSFVADSVKGMLDE